MVKFGKELGEKQAQLKQLLPPEAFLDYEHLKNLIHDDGPEHLKGIEIDGTKSSMSTTDFFNEWNQELEKIQGAIERVMLGKEKCGVPCGQFRISCASNALSPELADALFECIELNRAGFRKIVKKYDKNHPDEVDQQNHRLRMFDMVMRATMDDIEMQYAITTHRRQKKSTKMYQCIFVTIVAAIIAIVLVATKASNLRVAFVLGLIAAFMTAWGNAANDICNSVGTAVGAGALTLFQAIAFGAIFEVIGCMTLGPFVSKSIVKGIIEADDYESTPKVYAFGMVCVLFGSGTTTLLATFYGLPISATHGIIGGLISVGIAAKGVDSVGWDRVGVTAIGWVAAPLVGGIVSMAVFALIHKVIYKATEPVRRSKLMQPVFAWLCFAVNILFVLLKGPKFLKVKVLWLAVLIAAGAGIACIPLFYGIQILFRRLWPAEDKAAKVATCSSRAMATMERVYGLDKNDQTEKSNNKTFGFRINTMEKGETAQQEAQRESDKSDDKEIEVNNSEKYFVPLLIMSALSVACAHGGNDVGNAVGPLSAIIMVQNSGEVASKPDIPFWALAYGSIGFVLGIVTMGSLTIRTVGTKITTLCPSKSFATQMGGAIAVLGSSAAGLPVSTSHCLVGSVVGIGLYEKMVGTGRLNLTVLSRIAMAWGITIPLAMIVSVILFMPFKHLFE